MIINNENMLNTTTMFDMRTAKEYAFWFLRTVQRLKFQRTISPPPSASNSKPRNHRKQAIS
jgi:hypothetical protein